MTGVAAFGIALESKEDHVERLNFGMAWIVKPSMQMIIARTDNGTQRQELLKPVEYRSHLIFV